MVTNMTQKGDRFVSIWCNKMHQIKNKPIIFTLQIKKTIKRWSERGNDMVKVEKGISVNTSTGEVCDVYIEKEVSSQNFWKIWLGDILTVLGIISNSKQLDVVLYIMENIRPSDNLFVGSYDKIATGSNVSKRTVIRTMQKLLETEFLKKVQNGVYAVNAKYIVKGNENKRRMIIDYQNTLEPYNKNDTSAELNEDTDAE